MPVLKSVGSNLVLSVKITLNIDLKIEKKRNSRKGRMMTEKVGGQVQLQKTLTKKMASKFHGSRQAVHRRNRTLFTSI